MQSLPTSIASTEHDHGHCIDTAMARARDYCEQKGVRLTPQREQVFRLIWQSHRPLGAYTLMDMLAEKSTKRIAPPTIYRALDFLLEHQLIHRIHTLNAYVGCTHPDHEHSNSFMICEQCGIAIEFNAPHQDMALNKKAEEFGFEIKGQTMEVVGLCRDCTEAT